MSCSPLSSPRRRRAGGDPYSAAKRCGTASCKPNSPRSLAIRLLEQAGQQVVIVNPDAVGHEDNAHLVVGIEPHLGPGTVIVAIMAPDSLVVDGLPDPAQPMGSLERRLTFEHGLNGFRFQDSLAVVATALHVRD